MGAYLNIVMGMNYLGAEVYVAPEHIDKARELLGIIAPMNSEEEIEIDEDFEDELARSKKTKLKKGQLLIAFFLGIPILSILFIFIYAYLY